MKIYNLPINFNKQENTNFKRLKTSSIQVLKTAEPLEKTLAGLSVIGASSLISKKISRTLEESKMVGEYNFNEIIDGKNKSSATVTIDKSNNFNIKRNLFSSENVRSIYSKSGNENDYNISYKIVDENNNTLLDLKREFKVVDDSTTFSTLNNKEYTNKFSLCFIATDKKTPYGTSSSNLILNWKFEDLLKKLPGDFLETMKKYGVTLFEVNADNSGNAFATYSNKICMSEQLKNNPFVLAHELGHVISANKNIENDEELIKIYNQEKENLVSNQDPFLQDELSYFLSFDVGLKETVAESFAIISGLTHDSNCFGARTILLMQHFPKTIAKAVELLLKPDKKTSKKYF